MTDEEIIDYAKRVAVNVYVELSPYAVSDTITKLVHIINKLTIANARLEDLSSAQEEIKHLRDALEHIGEANEMAAHEIARAALRRSFTRPDESP